MSPTRRRVHYNILIYNIIVSQRFSYYVLLVLYKLRHGVAAETFGLIIAWSGRRRREGGDGGRVAQFVS